MVQMKPSLHLEGGSASRRCLHWQLATQLKEQESSSHVVVVRLRPLMCQVP